MFGARCRCNRQTDKQTDGHTNVTALPPFPSKTITFAPHFRSAKQHFYNTRTGCAKTRAGHTVAQKCEKVLTKRIIGVQTGYALSTNQMICIIHNVMRYLLCIILYVYSLLCNIHSLMLCIIHVY